MTMLLVLLGWTVVSAVLATCFGAMVMKGKEHKR